jgi:hypothetical protein
VAAADTRKHASHQSQPRTEAREIRANTRRKPGEVGAHFPCHVASPTNISRAYIAASRRSDRGLEARMESARRASAIHEKRTGRALRVTEADVVNEEMYEEINDLPSEYRRLNAHLQTQSTDFDRRLLAYLATQMGTRQAVSDCWQNQHSDYNTHGVNLSMLQEPSQHMASSHSAVGIATNHRQTPYPHVSQSMDPRQHVRSASMATPYAPGVGQQQLHSPFTSPRNDARHMSFPSNSAMQPPWTRPGVFTGSWSSNGMPRADSAVDLTGSPQYGQQHASSFIDSPQLGHQPWQAIGGDCTEPLSATLPLNSQQFFMQDPEASNTNGDRRSVSQDFTDRRYSYNPNGKPRPVLDSPVRLHGAKPLDTGPSSSSPSPLRLNTDQGSRPSTSSGGLGPEGTSTRGTLKTTTPGKFPTWEPGRLRSSSEQTGSRQDDPTCTQHYAI